MHKVFLTKSDSRPMDSVKAAFADVQCRSNLRDGPDNASMIWVVVNPDNYAATIAECLAKHPGNRVVCISYAPDVREALGVFKAGGKGYCHAMAPVSLFRQVAAVVENGGVWLGPEFMPHFLAGVSALLPESETSSSNELLDSLTQREREVALQAAKGISNKAIARVMDITERTVKAHLGAIFSKLNIRDRVHLILTLNQTDKY